MPILPDLQLPKQNKADVITTKSETTKCSRQPYGSPCTCAPENAAVYLSMSIEGSDPDEVCLSGEKSLCPSIVVSPAPRLWLKSTGAAVVLVTLLLPSVRSKLPDDETTELQVGNSIENFS